MCDQIAKALVEYHYHDDQQSIEPNSKTAGCMGLKRKTQKCTPVNTYRRPTYRITEQIIKQVSK